MLIELTEYTEDVATKNCYDLLQLELQKKEKKPTKIVNIEINCKGVKNEVNHTEILKLLELANWHFYCTENYYKINFKTKNRNEYCFELKAKMELENNYILKNILFQKNCLYKIKIELSHE